MVSSSEEAAATLTSPPAAPLAEIPSAKLAVAAASCSSILDWVAPVGPLTSPSLLLW